MPDHHKEVDPEVTITKIKDILNSVGFSEDKTTIIWNHAYSKKFEFLPLPNCLGKHKCYACGLNKNCFVKKRQKIQTRLKDLYNKHLDNKVILSKETLL